MMELLNGCKLHNGEYRIEKKIGQGGFGITYLARRYKEVQSAMGNANGYSIVVIKEFFWSKYCNRDSDRRTVSIPSAEGNEMMTQCKEKLKKEGEILLSLSHPNIVGILDVFEENNTAYSVMQFIEGEPLRDIIRKKGKISETTTLKYAKQICSALTEIHSKGILHLDIKPGNILIDKNNNVRIIDFGVCAGYSPVEQYGTLKSFSPPADIYALGATLYKMLAGKMPLEATNRNPFDLEPVTNLNPFVSRKTEEAIMKALSEKISDRFQTAEEFWQALRKEDKIYSLSNCYKTKIDTFQGQSVSFLIFDPERKSTHPYKKVLPDALIRSFNRLFCNFLAKCR